MFVYLGIFTYLLPRITETLERGRGENLHVSSTIDLQYVCQLMNSKNASSKIPHWSCLDERNKRRSWCNRSNWSNTVVNDFWQMMRHVRRDSHEETERKGTSTEKNSLSSSNQESTHSRFVDDEDDNRSEDIEEKSSKNNLHVSLAMFSHRSKPSVTKELDRWIEGSEIADAEEAPATLNERTSRKGSHRKRPEQNEKRT